MRRAYLLAPLVLAMLAAGLFLFKPGTSTAEGGKEAKE